MFQVFGELLDDPGSDPLMGQEEDLGVNCMHSEAIGNTYNRQEIPCII